jgi:cellulose synthase/poly-beta-1,6-N-acetylglucosamine synthase-like glycosyltransferase
LHWFWTGLLAFIALGWLYAAIDLARGALVIPALRQSQKQIRPPESGRYKVNPLPDSTNDPAGLPSISILFSALDEAEKLPAALATFLAQDYPDYEVIAVDDRSEDATGAILDASARANSRLKVVHVTSLPAGWLGKPHGLQTAFEHSTGEWLVLTDADVRFEPDVLRTTIALAEERQWDHLTLLCHAEMFTVGEKIAMTFFGMSFLLGLKPWRASDPKSGADVGVGAFQLIRRSAYEKMGTHRRLAMEVVDDVKVGKLVKQAGLRSGVAKAGRAVCVYWHAGLGNIIRGTTKNFYATAGFRLWVACGQVAGILLMFVLPWVALPFVHGWARGFAVVAIALPVMAQAGAAIEFAESPLYAVTQPLGALIFAWMIVRSTVVTLRQAGIWWRGTFYPIEELKRGVV